VVGRPLQHPQTPLRNRQHHPDHGSRPPAFDPQHSTAETIATGYRNAQNLIHGAPVALEKISAAVNADPPIL